MDGIEKLEERKKLLRAIGYVPRAHPNEEGRYTGEVFIQAEKFGHGEIRTLLQFADQNHLFLSHEAGVEYSLIPVARIYFREDA